MTNPTHDAQTVREMQQLAVAALDELLSLDLPEVHWTISPHISRPELDGQAGKESDDESRDIVRCWARALKAEVIEERAINDRFTTVKVDATFEGIRVKVWTHVDRVEQ